MFTGIRIFTFRFTLYLKMWHSILMRRFWASPVTWAIVFFLFALLLTFISITRIEPFLTEKNIALPPQAPPDIVQIWPTTPPPVGPGETPPPTPVAFSSIGPLIIFFLVSVAIVSAILLLVPVSALKTILRLLFATLFAWGTFILLILWSPVALAMSVALVVGALWFLVPRVWFHNLVMLFSMAAVGTVFGWFIPPWTAMVLLAVLGIYDFLAVRFGFMMWMVKQMSNTDALPAFILPRASSEWNAPLRESNVNKIVAQKPSEREFAILGGGDFGFPLLLISSTYFAYGLPDSLVLAGCAVAGLVGAYVIQSVFLKGKPMPGLPPIAVTCLVGLLLMRFVF